MADEHSEESEALRAQPLEVLSGLEAIARVERAICADGVTQEPAAAEGLALAGLRAASLADGATAGAGGGIALPAASCVHHVNGVAGQEVSGAFELAATSVQEAVDHCLAAHLLSQRLGRAGLCSLAPSLTQSLTLVRLPGSDLVSALLESEPRRAETNAGLDRVLDLARSTLQTVSEHTGRPADLVAYQGPDDAEIVLVASGAEAAACRDVARTLCEAGVPTGALSVILLRPFPRQRVREALAGTRRVFVVGDGARRELLLAELRAATPAKTKIHPLPAVGPARLLERMTAELPPGAIAAKLHAPTSTLPSRRLVLAPAGPWAEEIARRISAAVGYLGPLQLGPRTREWAGAMLLAWDGEAIPEAGGDLLVAGGLSLLDPRGALSLLRTGSTVVVVAAEDSDEALAEALEPDARAAIRERDLRVHWLALPELEEAESKGEAAFLLAGAALAALGEAGAPREIQAGETVARRLEAAGQPEAACWLRAGSERLQSLDPASLDPERHVEELDFRPAPKLPRMPAAVDDEAERARWAERIRRFHLTGAGSGPAPHLPIRPAALGSLAEALRASSPHPFVLVRCDDAEQPLVARPLGELLGEATEALQQAGRSARALADNLKRLVTLCARELAEGAAGVAVERLVSEAGERLVDELALPEQEESELKGDLAELRRRLPGEAPALDVRAETPLRVYLEALHAVREPLRRRFVEELDALRERLRDLLQLDRMASEEGRTPEALAATLGGAATDYLDPEALSKTLPATARSALLGDERRSRIRKVLATIENHLEEQEGLPRVIFLLPPSAEPAPGEGEQHRHPDPLAAAVGLFDGISRRMAEVFRAARTARLEAAGSYHPEIHDTALAELDWEAFSAHELALVPAVVAQTSGRRLRRRDQRSLSELLRSSRPVHVIIYDEVGAFDEAEDLSRFHIDLGYLVVAHREAVAIGSTLARPQRMVEGLARMVRAPRPGVFLVQLPAQEQTFLRSLLSEAALHGRACLEFRYEPDAGPSWADRFDLGGNPDPDRSWPIHSIRHLDGETEQTLEVALTFADAVALEPAYRRHFRLVPPAAWDETQMPLADYLERFDPEVPQRAIPFLWVIGEDGTLQRAIPTRELALASRDRLRSWQVLQELAGYRNVFAERAAEAARSQALAEAEARTAELEKAHAEELERVRSETARESMERLAAVLISPDGVPAAISARAPAAPPPIPAEPMPEAAAEPAPVEEAEEEEAISFDEPYIDAPLCTTCNECTQINAQLFKYNADKQAYIADIGTGTFAELVKAAELCPGRCIHPGKPREGDASATPDLIERAAPFN